MRRLKTSLALAVALALLFGANPLFAQPEAPASASPPVEVPSQPDETSVAIEPADTKPVESKADTEHTEDDATDAQKDLVVGSAAPLDVPEKTETPEAKPVQTRPPAATNTTPGRFALTFDDLKFEMEKTEAFDRKMLSSKINSYHGSKVKIRGYIRPNFKQSGITKFIFVRDNKECCFGPQAAIFDNILVRLKRGNSTNYTVRPVTIEGDFVLKEYHGDDGNVWSLYRMYNAKIK